MFRVPRRDAAGMVLTSACRGDAFALAESCQTTSCGASKDEVIDIRSPHSGFQLESSSNLSSYYHHHLDNNLTTAIILILPLLH